MRLPRDLTGRELATLFRRHYSYEIVRQTGSHMRLTTAIDGTYSITIPAGGPLRVGTLAAILGDVAVHHSVTRAELERKLFE